MRVPRKISELVSQKQAFIDKQRDKLIKSVADLQADLLNAIIAELIPALDTKGGIILETENNYKLISVLDKVYADFSKRTLKDVLKEVTTIFKEIQDRNYDFMVVTLAGDLPEKFKDTVKKAKEITDLRFGIKGGKYYPGGFLDSLLKENNSLALKRKLAKLLTSQANTKEFIEALRKFFKSNEAFEAKFKWFAFDVYQQYDAIYNATLGKELGLTNFIYQGGLIEDSRDFCAAHDGKVWTVKEAEGWAEWRPIDGVKENMYPSGYEVKAKDLYEVPSYLGYAGYNPLYDRGGYHCRHQLSYISDQLAKRLRPVKNKNEKS